MVTFVTPRDRPSYYTAIGQIAGENVLVSSLTQVGDSTGIAGVLTVYHDDDADKYLRALAETAIRFAPLPDHEQVEAGQVYKSGDKLVVVRESHYRDSKVSIDDSDKYVVVDASSISAGHK